MQKLLWLIKPNRRTGFSLLFVLSFLSTMIIFQNCSPTAFTQNKTATASGASAASTGSASDIATSEDPSGGTVSGTGSLPTVISIQDVSVPQKNTAEFGVLTNLPLWSEVYKNSNQCAVSDDRLLRISSKRITLSGLPAEGAILRVSGSYEDGTFDGTHQQHPVVANINEQKSPAGWFVYVNSVNKVVVHNGDTIQLMGRYTNFLNKTQIGEFNLRNLSDTANVVPTKFWKFTSRTGPSTIALTKDVYTDVPSNSDPSAFVSPPFKITLMNNEKTPVFLVRYGNFYLLINGVKQDSINTQCISVKDGDTVQFVYDLPSYLIKPSTKLNYWFDIFAEGEKSIGSVNWELRVQ